MRRTTDVDGPPETMRAGRYGFEPRRLERYLKTALPAADGEMRLERVEGGQSNPSFFVTIGDRRLVLRKKPPGTLLPSAHAVDREFRVMKALAGSSVPVPAVLLYEADEAVVGTPFYVMERVEGRIFHDSSLPDVPPEARAAMYRETAAVLARLHGVDHAARGLADYGRADGYFARQMHRWSRQWADSRARDLPEVDALAAWLSDNLPQDDATAIVHGDFRLGNIIFHPVEPRIVAVLDWELSTLGDPLADLAHTWIFTWCTRAAEYGGLLDADSSALGIPEPAAFAQAYYDASGTERRLRPFHLCFALFRNAVIFEGIAARARVGNAASANAAEVGRLAPVFARRALDIARSGSLGAGA